MSSVLSQFRERYPQAGLTAELLMVQGNQFVVRAQVVLEGTTIATGMAAALTVEQAEDLARLRALQILGIAEISTMAPLSPLPTPTPLRPIPPPILTGVGADPEADDPPADLPPKALPKRLDLAQDRPIELPTAPIAQVSPTRGSASTDASAPLPDPTPLVPAGAPVKPKGTAPISTATADPNPEEGTEPVDLSDIIIQTDVELRRLGWTVAQGREYLEQSYNKRSRHDLTDEELLEFLLYLETLPSPTGAPS